MEEINTTIFKSPSEIVRDYYKLTKAKLDDVIRFPIDNRENKVYVFRRNETIGLQINYDVYHYLTIKKTWIRYEYWSDDRIPSCKKQKGVTLQERFYNYIKRQTDRTSFVVIYILRENKFYFTPVTTFLDFIERKSSFFTDGFNNQVVGVSKEIFETDVNMFL